MTNDERRFRRKSLAAVVIGIVASVALLSLLYIVGTHRCLDKTLGFGQETMVFLKNACEKYDRYEQGRKTEATHNLDAALESFATFLPPDRFEVNDDLVEEYVHTESLSGMLVMDADGHMVAPLRYRRPRSTHAVARGAGLFVGRIHVSRLQSVLLDCR